VVAPSALNITGKFPGEPDRAHTHHNLIILPQISRPPRPLITRF